MEKEVKQDKVDTKQTKQEPQNSGYKETRYCLLMASSSILDKQSGRKYVMEKIYIKELHREEIRLSLYQKMRNRDGGISSRLLIRPVDLTEQEWLDLLTVSFKEKMFSDEFMKSLKNIVNQIK